MRKEIIRGTLVLAGVLISLSAVAGVTLNAGAGSIKGVAENWLHDFDVKPTRFLVTISDPSEAGVRQVEARIPVKYIRTGNETRDRHMLEQIFDAGLAKGIGDMVFTAQSSELFKPGTHKLVGKLNINGVSLPSTLTVAVSGDQTVTLKASTVVNYEQYGIDRPGMGPMKVKAEIPVRLELNVPRSEIVAGEKLTLAR